MPLITTQEATELEERYTTTRGDFLDQHLGYEDTNCFEVSIEDLKEFIEQVESESADKGYKNIGLAIYMGATAPNGEGKTFATTFITATRDNGEINSTDIQPLDGFVGKTKKYDC